MTGLAVSVSKINAFRTCKHKYKLAYIDKVEQEQFGFFKKGSDIHKAFENVSLAPGGEENPVVSGFFASDVGRKYLPMILRAEKEVPFGLKVQNGGIVPCGFSDEDAFFHGIIDVLNGNTILDYKTGKKKEFKDQDWKQLMFYAAWLFLKHPEYSEVNISYLYVEHNHENALTVKREHLNAIIKKLLLSVSDILNFVKNPTEEHRCSQLCEYCGCRKHCRFYKEYTESKLENIKFETF